MSICWLKSTPTKEEIWNEISCVMKEKRKFFGILSKKIRNFNRNWLLDYLNDVEPFHWWFNVALNFPYATKKDI